VMKYGGRLVGVSVVCLLLCAAMASADTLQYPVALDFTASASGNGSAPQTVANGRAYGWGYVYWSSYPGAVYGEDSHGSAAANVVNESFYTDVLIDIWMLPGSAQMPDVVDPMNPFPGPPIHEYLPAGGDASVSGTLAVGAPGVSTGTQMLIDITVPTCIANGDYMEWSCTVKRGEDTIAGLGTYTGYSAQIAAVAGEQLSVYVAANDMSSSMDATDNLVVRFTTTPVPEPTTMGLLALGAAPALLRRRRR
jgi:PEP-CTERM motif-containing protein